MAERDGGDRERSSRFESETNHQTPMKPYSEVGHKKKPTSFQITSVTVQGSRLSNDGGDDSADDLDESHTDDLSSDILECSKTPDLDNEQLTEDNSNTPDDLAASGTFASLKSFRSDSGVRPIADGNDVPQHVGISTTFHTNSTVNSNVPVDSGHSDAVVNSHLPMINTIPDHWQHRFKVVKIVSSEPFKRGRWLCMDFVDPPAMQQEIKPEVVDQTGISNVSSNASSANSLCGDNSANKTVAHVYEIPVTRSCTGDVSVAINQQPVQPLYGIILPVETVGRTPQITMVPTVGLQPASDVVPQVIQTAIPPGVHVTSGLPPPQTSQTQLASVNAPSVQHNPLTSQPQLVTQTQQQVMPMSQPPAVASQPSLVTNIQTIPLTATPIDQEVGRQSVSKPDPSSQGPSPVIIATNNDKAQRMTSENPPLQLLEVLPDALRNRNNIDGEESESASAGSTVAIDNKIEQAMDLVKSHLMFAVREEVDVLKEKITELLERISQLEYENGFLRANASQETLNQLSQIPTSQTAVTQTTVLAAPTQQQQQQPST
ncbi:TSC22 domain family protein 1-like [Centruroides sculpturatus]|uniref:TSC22 domain family protein 1-like n=1 Tax=Centruroides sculpturatus TaxID=218467 RepID=UPI000C6CA048|nr:TSC22 domain family protein 1-like [Centruroides sculpturatus]